MGLHQKWAQQNIEPIFCPSTPSRQNVKCTFLLSYIFWFLNMLWAFHREFLSPETILSNDFVFPIHSVFVYKTILVLFSCGHSWRQFKNSLCSFVASCRLLLFFFFEVPEEITYGTYPTNLSCVAVCLGLMSLCVSVHTFRNKFCPSIHIFTYRTYRTPNN